MNRSEQIQEKLKNLSELERLLPSLLDEGDQQLVQDVLEQLNALAKKTERVVKLLEMGSDLLQEARSLRECDPSPRGNKQDDEALQDKFVSSPPKDEPPGDTPAMGMSLPPEVVYIQYKDIKSKAGHYMNKPDSETKFQITVSQSDPSLGILQFRDGLDEFSKGEIQGDMGHPLIRRESSWGGEGRSQDTYEDGEVRLDPARETWMLITPIRIK